MYSCSRIVSFLFSFLLFVYPNSAASELAEEGCRYHGSLEAIITYLDKRIEYDFWKEHEAMAKVIQADSDDGQYSSMLRFNSVIFVDNVLQIGPAVSLCPIDSLNTSGPVYELGFASGLFNSSSQDVSMKHSTPTALKIFSSGEVREKPGIMTLRPALHKRQKETLPNKNSIRFLMANFVDPGILKLQLTQRYVDIDGSLINSAGRDAICNPHVETLKAIELRNKRCIEIFTQIAAEITEDATPIVIGRYQTALDEVKTPNSNEKTNSYNCAEQCQFTYLRDIRVFKYLQEKLRVDSPDFIGVIINAHCSHTPCHSCATSFTRESEPNGIFYQMANGRPVHILCSCQAHYERPKKMLPYQQTSFFEVIQRKDALRNPQTLSFGDGAKSVYPVVLMKSDPQSGDYSVDFEHYSKLER